MSKDRPSGSPDASRSAEFPAARVSDVLDEFLAHGRGADSGAVDSGAAPSPTISLGEVMAVLGDRAFAALLLILAIPNVLPVPGLSTATGVPMILLGAQMALGRDSPWLPRRLLAVAIDRNAFLGVIGRARPWAVRLERRLRPRLPALTGPLAERLLGVAVMVLAGIMALPIVFGNQPPALSIALIAIGLMESDGLFVSAGLAAGVLSIAIIAAILLGLGQAAVMLAQQLFG